MEPIRVISSPQNFMVDRAYVSTLLSTIKPREGWKTYLRKKRKIKFITKRKNNCKFKGCQISLEDLVIIKFRLTCRENCSKRLRKYLCKGNCHFRKIRIQERTIRLAESTFGENCREISPFPHPQNPNIIPSRQWWQSDRELPTPSSELYDRLLYWRPPMKCISSIFFCNTESGLDCVTCFCQ